MKSLGEIKHEVEMSLRNQLWVYGKSKLNVDLAGREPGREGAHKDYCVSKWVLAFSSKTAIWPACNILHILPFSLVKHLLYTHSTT